MTRFETKKEYVFDYNRYVETMRQHGYQPDTDRKILHGQRFTMQESTEYVVLRKGHFWATVNPNMCAQV